MIDVWMCSGFVCATSNRRGPSDVRLQVPLPARHRRHSILVIARVPLSIFIPSRGGAVYHDPGPNCVAVLKAWPARPSRGPWSDIRSSRNSLTAACPHARRHRTWPRDLGALLPAHQRTASRRSRSRSRYRLRDVVLDRKRREPIPPRLTPLRRAPPPTTGADDD